MVLRLNLDTDAALDAYAADRAQYARDLRDTFANGGERRTRRARLFAWQGGVCVKCGEEMSLDAPVGDDTRAEWAHLRTARRYCCPDVHCPGIHAHGEGYSVPRAGFRWGNLTLWHTSCNRSWSERDALRSDLARPDLIFTGVTRALPRV